MTYEECTFLRYIHSQRADASSLYSVAQNKPDYSTEVTKICIIIIIFV